VTVRQELEYRYERPDASTGGDQILVIASFSGGGTRAAALAYGVLQELEQAKFTRDGEQRTLLTELDVISSVSGGSFPAAYLALHGKEKLLVDFKRDFLHWNLQRRLIPSLLSPRVWVSPRYSRIDYAADLYDQRLFRRKTFGDLRPRPFLMINATDMASGDQFSFTDEQFDALGRRLASQSLARAVAASSAFPVLLAPILEENKSKSNPVPLRKEILESIDACEKAPEPMAAMYADHCAYSRSLKGYAGRGPYLHLLDGGVADNLGVRPIIRSLQRHDSDFSLPQILARTSAGPGGGHAKGAVVLLIVNARTEARTSLTTALQRRLGGESSVSPQAHP